jgi:hypothetical protein
MELKITRQFFFSESKRIKNFKKKKKKKKKKEGCDFCPSGLLASASAPARA